MWQSSGNHSVWSRGEFSAQVDLAEPFRGLRSLRVQGATAAALRPLQLNVRNEPSGEAGVLRDAYVRGKDLVGTYAESSALEFLPQIYWRMLEPAEGGRIAALDLILSVQTRLLDSTATVQSVTHVGPGEVLRWTIDAAGLLVREGSLERPETIEVTAPTIILFRPAESDWSYTEMVDPPDFRRWRWEPLSDEPGWNQWAWSLFAERLEKGVIRRGRLRAAWLPREGDTEQVRREFADFLNAPLPLTT